ncbi:hypothetical protein GCM10009817_28520 [Terrabacter lapilli]|uniref:Uncharacterized protein n=1 Tax=Terrabacter lapilli TaxID=436231 RepID=A0ABN2SEZ2_9MICO
MELRVVPLVTAAIVGSAGRLTSACRSLLRAVNHGAVVGGVTVGHAVLQAGVPAASRAGTGLPEADQAADSDAELGPVLQAGPAMASVHTARERQALTDVERALRRRFPTVDAVVVEAAVRLAYGELTGPVRAYVPLLVERGARDRLDRLVGGASDLQQPSA